MGQSYLRPTMMNILQGVICLLVVAYLASAATSYYRLRKFPGPLLAKVSNLWILKTLLSGEAHQRFIKINGTYGPYLCVGPNAILTDDDELFRRINAVHSNYRRSRFFKLLRIFSDSDFTASAIEGGTHKALRTKFAPSYLGKETAYIEPSFDKVLFDFINIIRSRYISHVSDLRALDFAMMSQYFALDALTALVTGETVGHMATEMDLYSIITNAEKGVATFTWICSLPWLTDLLTNETVRSFFRAAIPLLQNPVATSNLRDFTADIIAKRYKEPKGTAATDFIGSFRNHGISEEDALVEALAEIASAPLTFATAFRATIFLILHHQPVHNRLLDEIRSANIPKDTIIPKSTAATLPYLNAVLKESLRIFPPLVGLSNRVAPPEGDVLPNGTFLPGNTLVGVNLWSMQRRASIFGPDAHAFRPERWIEAARDEPEKLKRMERTVDLIFNYGRFQCLGKGIAMMEMQKSVFELLRRFEMAVLDPRRPWVMWDRNVFVIKDFWLRVEEREM